MAVFVELPDDDTAPQDAADARYAAECQARAAFETGGLNTLSIADQPVEVINANRNSITEVFACYPNNNNHPHRPQHPRQPRAHLPADPREPAPVPVTAHQPHAAL
ncbi:hypothetical protein V501_01835 [Pseudogymnoascus sp. VKM F-4519 (FW-2642)]|nr:hypothetical protein V501_01835 [Pseudogymnoascus sp. VKM F-4519 (FW-2642)]